MKTFIVFVFGISTLFAKPVIESTCNEKYENIWINSLHFCIEKNPSYISDDEHCSAIYGAGGMTAFGYGYSFTIYNNCEETATTNSFYGFKENEHTFVSYTDDDTTSDNPKAKCSKNFTAVIGCNKGVSELNYKSKLYNIQERGIQLLVVYDITCVNDINAEINLLNLCDATTKSFDHSYSSNGNSFTCGNINLYKGKYCPKFSNKHTDTYYKTTKQKSKEVAQTFNREEL
ncbi:ER-localized apoptosis regulator [Eptesipox virus]|nr:ER-localized apoptosis regulator [Eptesipox virus]WAH71144.1 ER-localized apoptosis regulator [Eptesipox virus]